MPARPPGDAHYAASGAATIQAGKAPQPGALRTTVKAFVDTNVLVYAYDRGAGVEHERALKPVAGLCRDGNGAISTRVLRESQGPAAHLPQEAGSLIGDYLTWEPIVDDGDAVLEAIDAEGRPVSRPILTQINRMG